MNKAGSLLKIPVLMMLGALLLPTATNASETRGKITGGVLHEPLPGLRRVSSRSQTMLMTPMKLASTCCFFSSSMAAPTVTACWKSRSKPNP